MVRSARAVPCALLVILGVVAPPPLEAQVGEPGAPRSPRLANYRIDVRLDPVEKRLEGSQMLTWTNAQEEAADELWFHLYWNAFRNDHSTWMLEDRLRGRGELGEDIRDGDWGWIDVDALQVSSSGAASAGGDAEASSGWLDLSDAMRFVSPDDGNPDDRTVMMVSLPEPVEPGESIEVAMAFSAKVPRTFARTGFRGDFFFIAHWYPAIAVFEEGGWNCHQFHAATEFYADYGVYDVSITVPSGWVLGASGRRVDERENDDGTVSLRHVAEDVHNFAWTTSPDYVVLERRFEKAGLPAVDMRLLMQPEHLAQADRHFAATEAALEHYGTWYGPYPYSYLTVVDPAYGSGAGGMEYPTLFTCGTRLFNPPGGGSPEGVTVHEAGHQFWYGIVGNNEFEDAWLDEGLNTFSTARTMDAAFGESFLTRRYLSLSRDDGGGRRDGGFFVATFPAIRETRLVAGDRLDRYRRDATWDAPSTPTFGYFPKSASSITYSKTALWLHTLERTLGWETLRQILQTFFERYAFRHPRPEDFFAVVDETAGEDLGWFFDQVFHDSVTFDYAVESVSSRPAEVNGFVEDDEGVPVLVGGGDGENAGTEPRRYRTEVVVRRLGAGHFPVDVLMVFEDGSEVRRAWDGRYRWRLFVEERESKLEYAVVDPERELLLDLDYTNNSRLREPAAELPARKWASKWMLWLQDLMAGFSFFV